MGIGDSPMGRQQYIEFPRPVEAFTLNTENDGIAVLEVQHHWRSFMLTVSFL